jgi:hypothetical protein
VIVAADASEYGVGAIIQNRWPDGSIEAIAHASCLLIPAEQNNNQIEKEVLALIFAINFSQKNFMERTSYSSRIIYPCLSTFGNRKDTLVHSANRQHRWAATLLGYEFMIEYRKSTDFDQANAIYSLISAHSAPDEEVVVAALQAEFNM